MATATAANPSWALHGDGGNHYQHGLQHAVPVLFLRAGTRQGAYWSIIGDHKGNAYCCRCLCASCAREHINGIPDRAGKSPYQSLDPRKELRLLQARKNRARARRNQAVAHLLFWLVIAFACVAVAAFIVCASYTITKIVLG